MNILRRIEGMVSGLLGKSEQRPEDKSPERLIAEAQSRIEKSRKEAGTQLVEIQTWAEMARVEMKEAEVRLADVRGKIRLAAQVRDRELLTELFLQEEHISRDYEEKKQYYEGAREQAVQVRDHFRQFESEMNDRLRELSAIRSQSQLVRLRENIAKIDDRYSSVCSNGVSPSELQVGIDRMRKGLNERYARVSAVAKLRSSNTDEQVRRLDHRLALERASGKAMRLLEGGYDEEQNRYGSR